MKNRKNNAIKNVLTIVLLTALLASGVYAWIVGDVVPEITGKISIGNETGIVLELDETTEQVVDLNQQFGIETKNLSFTEVSSADGRTFFKRDTSVWYEDSNNNEIITFVKATPYSPNSAISDSSSDTAKGSYIDLEMVLKLSYASEDTDYYVYFLNGMLTSTKYTTGFSQGSSKKVTTDGLKAMRVALEMQGLPETMYNEDVFTKIDETNSYIAIFGQQTENTTLASSENKYRTNAVISTEKIKLKSAGTDVEIDEDVCGIIDGTVYGELSGVSGDNVNILGFGDYSIGDGDNPIKLFGPTIPRDNYLFVLNDDYKFVKMNLRIWLEGGSEYCNYIDVTPSDNDTEDSVILNLYFAAFAKTNKAAS